MFLFYKLINNILGLLLCEMYLFSVFDTLEFFFIYNREVLALPSKRFKTYAKQTLCARTTLTALPLPLCCTTLAGLRRPAGNEDAKRRWQEKNYYDVMRTVDGEAEKEVVEGKNLGNGEGVRKGTGETRLDAEERKKGCIDRSFTARASPAPRLDGSQLPREDRSSTIF